MYIHPAPIYTAFVLCKCVLTYIFPNYYKINKDGRTWVCLKSPVVLSQYHAGHRLCMAVRGPKDTLAAKITRFQASAAFHACRLRLQ